jgi:hypothetical protein
MRRGRWWSTTRVIIKEHQVRTWCLQHYNYLYNSLRTTSAHETMVLMHPSTVGSSNCIVMMYASTVGVRNGIIHNRAIEPHQIVQKISWPLQQGRTSWDTCKLPRWGRESKGESERHLTSSGTATSSGSLMMTSLSCHLDSHWPPSLHKPSPIPLLPSPLPPFSLKGLALALMDSRAWVN